MDYKETDRLILDRLTDCREMDWLTDCEEIDWVIWWLIAERCFDWLIVKRLIESFDDWLQRARRPVSCTTSVDRSDREEWNTCLLWHGQLSRLLCSQCHSGKYRQRGMDYRSVLCDMPGCFAYSVVKVTKMSTHEQEGNTWPLHCDHVSRLLFSQHH